LDHAFLSAKAQGVISCVCRVLSSINQLVCLASLHGKMKQHVVMAGDDQLGHSMGQRTCGQPLILEPTVQHGRRLYAHTLAVMAVAVVQSTADHGLVQSFFNTPPTPRIVFTHTQHQHRGQPALALIKSPFDKRDDTLLLTASTRITGFR
jgi:hypothetical protein